MSDFCIEEVVSLHFNRLNNMSDIIYGYLKNSGDVLMKIDASDRDYITIGVSSIPDPSFVLSECKRLGADMTGVFGRVDMIMGRKSNARISELYAIRGVSYINPR